MKWPDDFPDEAQRGKTKTVRATLSEVKRKELPALDDAFAREMGDFDSLEAFTKVVREDIDGEQPCARPTPPRARSSSTRSSAANPFDDPAELGEADDPGLRRGVQDPEEEIVKFADEIRGMAERQVRRDLIVDIAGGAREARRDGGRRGRQGGGAGRQARRSSRASSTRPCRRRGASASLSAASPRSGSSRGSSAEHRSNRR